MFSIYYSRIVRNTILSIQIIYFVKQEHNPMNKKVYTPIKVSLLGNISELTQQRSLSGPMMGGGMNNMKPMIGGRGPA